MEFVISFDMRAPDFGAPAKDLWRATLDMAEWGDKLGFNAVAVGEHHASPDGYLPSPLPLIAAIASRTEQAKLRAFTIAPLYEPVKLAEDLSVIQLISEDRLQVIIMAGYRPYEFEMFGTKREDRKDRYLEVYEVLRNAWTGKEFEYKGRKVTITPQPNEPPKLLLGGAHPAVARRAARIADGYYPPGGQYWDIYREERLKLGKTDPGESFHMLGPIYTYVTHDKEAAWEKVLPHAVHCVESYTEWTVEAYGRASGPFADGVDPKELRDSGAYQILTPEECTEMIMKMDDATSLCLFPLLGGLDPEFAWEGLKLFEKEVWPHVKHRAADQYVPRFDEMETKHDER